MNPAKNELGRIRKMILDKINSSISEHFSLNHWKNRKNILCSWECSRNLLASVYLSISLANGNIRGSLQVAVFRHQRNVSFH